MERAQCVECGYRVGLGIASEPEVLLERVSGSEHRLLVERLGDDLEPHRQAVVRRQTTRDADRRVAREVHGNGEYVGQVHREWIGDALPHPEGRGR